MKKFLKDTVFRLMLLELGEKEKENMMIGDDEKVEKKLEEELLKKDWSVGEKEKQRKSTTKNRDSVS